MRVLARIAAVVRGWFRPGVSRRRGLGRTALSSRTADPGEHRGRDDARRGATGRAPGVRQRRGDPRRITGRPAGRAGASARPRPRLRHPAAAQGAGVCAITSALVVALGIGTTTAIFSVVYGVMLRPLPFARARSAGGAVDPAPESAQRVRANAADHRDWRSSNSRVRRHRARQRAPEFQPDWIGRTGAPVRGAPVVRTLHRCFASRRRSAARSRRRRAERQRPRRAAQRRAVEAAVRRGPVDRRTHDQPERKTVRSRRRHAARLPVPRTRAPAVDPADDQPDGAEPAGADYDHLAVARLKPGAASQQAQREIDTIAPAARGRLPGDQPRRSRRSPAAARGVDPRRPADACT